MRAKLGGMRSRAVLCLLLPILLSVGCLRDPQVLGPAEVELVAWYMEDLAHGLERDPYELLTAEPSQGMEAIALWALGSVTDNRSTEPPRLLRTRRARWPLLVRGLNEGAILLDPENGLLRLDDALSTQTRSLYVDDVDQENLDRLQLDSILLARGKLHPDARRGEELLRALTAARRQHALAAGGRLVLREEGDAARAGDGEAASDSR